MKRLVALFDRFWFPTVHPSGLAVLRILVGVYVLALLLDRQTLLSQISQSTADVFDPVGAAAFLPAPLPAETFTAIVGLTLLFNVAFLLGWGFRASGPLFGGLLLFVLSYRNSWSMIYHSDNLLVLHVLILAFARSADVYSIDAFARWAYARFRPPQPLACESAAAWSYGWPIQLMCTVTVLAYFLAGVAKVAGPLGWTWAGGGALRSQVAADLVRKQLLSGESPLLASLLYEHVWVFTLAGISVLILELGAPAAALDKRIARVWTIATFALHWGILLIMGIKFRYQLAGVAFASFFVRDLLVAPRVTSEDRTAS